MNAIKNITIGHTERLYKPVGYTMLANLVNIVPFCLSIEAIRIIFNAFDGSGQPLDTTRLWWMRLTGADSRSTRPVFGGYSALWLYICWSWLWLSGYLIAPIFAEPTK